MICVDCKTKMLATLEMDSSSPIWLCPQCLTKILAEVSKKAHQGMFVFRLDEMVEWAKEFVFHQMDSTCETKAQP